MDGAVKVEWLEGRRKRGARKEIEGAMMEEKGDD